MRQLYSNRVYALYGEMNQQERVAQITAFKDALAAGGNEQEQGAREESDSQPTLVSTDVAARGIDIQGIALVVNFKLPLSPDEYLHRVGRTARAGANGTAVTFVTPTEEDRFYPINRRAGGVWDELTLDPADIDALRKPVERALVLARRVMLGRMPEDELVLSRKQ